MTIRIQGDARYIAESEFRPEVQRCIDLLQEKAAHQYGIVNAQNLTIRAFSKSGANFANSSIDIARETFDPHDAWLASVIVHEAIHFQQYRGGTYSRNPVENERPANRIQLETLRLIEAPQYIITHLLNQDGSHSDLNGDGVYDERDYMLRNW